MKVSIKHVKPDSKYKGGIYKPLNLEKYIGPVPIVCRSSWERKYCQYCDLKDEIIKWSSESMKIKYYNPLTKKNHTYFPDFYIKVLNPNGSVQEFIVEIKPSNYLRKPELPKKNSEKALSNYKYKYESFIRNYAKAKAAKEYAKERGMRYIIITEKTLK